MNKHKITLAVALVVILVSIGFYLLPKKSAAPAPIVTVETEPVKVIPAAGIDDLILVGNPVAGQTVTSPLPVYGSARGNWYFEASFPIQLLDSAGKEITTTTGKAQSDWMTSDFVVFKADLTFPPQPSGSHGTVVLKNDNPSGDPAKEKSVKIDVVF